MTASDAEYLSFTMMLSAFQSMTSSELFSRLPHFKASMLIDLARKATLFFSKEPIVNTIFGEIIIVGDLHGHFFDLARILNRFGYPPHKKYLFLGDTIDRGQFSLETITLIYLLKVQFPDNIYFVRGNHEFRSIAESCGFYNEIVGIYGRESASSIFDEFVNSFSQIPLAALINDEYFCVHGGIGPHLETISQIDSIPRPLNELYGGLADSLLWSDPSDNIERFEASTRGRGFMFGKKAIEKFISNNKLKLIIRGHQPVQEGVKYQLNGKIVTVFSASNYCGTENNTAAVMILKPETAEKTNDDNSSNQNENSSTNYSNNHSNNNTINNNSNNNDNDNDDNNDNNDDNNDDDNDNDSNNNSNTNNQNSNTDSNEISVDDSDLNNNTLNRSRNSSRYKMNNLSILIDNGPTGINESDEVFENEATVLFPPFEKYIKRIDITFKDISLKRESHPNCSSSRSKLRNSFQIGSCGGRPRSLTINAKSSPSGMAKKRKSFSKLQLG
ncbi:hypothetical protein TRFO_30136 [Tritrichomonas foetus]|uniref:Serine/threonine-protein phosphatase n=1 Tax=Tritrichomonas foetus TaxID=1144522 RepID=A0A1J4JYW7_9EUKA|nr:hypothetical protein TRFO_30136 [Tritrichomonas foetus]|eukprot:OHT02694.1 hypothetical protein TRFO_30136 [Tritrichomonas foetus]